MGTIGTQAVNPLIYSRRQYHAARDFAAIAFVADAETVLVVHPSVTARSSAELIAPARSKPGEITFASGGAGTTGQLAGELLRSQSQIAITHVPYKGNVPALNDLVSGQVSMSFATLAPALPFIKDNKLIALATAGSKRTPALPDVPTMAEQGFKNFEVRNWTGLLAPAGTPPAITHKIAAEVDSIIQSPEAQKIFTTQGLTYTRMGPDRSESAKWGTLVRQASIKADRSWRHLRVSGLRRPSRTLLLTDNDGQENEWTRNEHATTSHRLERLEPRGRGDHGARQCRMATEVWSGGFATLAMGS